MAKEYLKDSARLLLPLYRFETETIKFVYAGYSSIKKNYYRRLIPGQKHPKQVSGIPELLADPIAC